jgi:hypothetical protein
MATGPLTQITDLVVPEIFTPYVQQLTEEKSRLIQSGATTVNPILSNFLSGGGLTVDVPSFKDLDNEEENIPTDDPADSIIASYQGGTPTDANRKDSVPKKTGTSTEIAVRISRNQSWSAADLAADLAGADPMGSIASRVAKYWALRFQAIFVATTNGIIKANVAANGGDFQNDVSGAAFADGVTNFSAEAFIDAAATMGDSSDDLSLMMTHSVVMARMKKNNLIDYIPDSEGRVMIPTFLGHEVIVDDGMPATGGVFDTWIFGAGAFQIGHAFVGTTSKGGPSNGTGANQSLEPPALLGKPLTVDAQGKQATSFRFASDLFDGLMNVAGTPRKRGAGEPRQSWRIRHELARRVGVPAVRPPLRSEPPVAARGQQQAPRAKALPGPRALEWRPWCPAGIGAEANKRLFSQADRQARIGAH